MPGIQGQLQKVQFLKSAPRFKDCPPDAGYEIVFAGRSNAGKSRALNAITGQGKLARISKTPGRTQALNFFRVDDMRRLVDLPGYGYAKVAKEVKERWQRELERFLQHRQCLQGVVLIMDVRHPLQDFDRMMLEWAAHYGLPVHILLTKADKLNRGPGLKVLRDVHDELADWPAPVTAQLFSALKGRGVEEAQAVLADWLDWSPE